MSFSLASTSRREAVVKGAVIGAVASIVIVLMAWGGLLSGPRIALRVEARDLSTTEFAFEPDALVTSAATQVALSFVNSSVEPHNLVLLAPIETRTDHNVPTGESRMLEFVTPAAGTYRFVCTIHEGMTGTLLVR